MTAPSTAVGYQVPSALFKPVRLAQASTLPDSGNSTANDVINARGIWQGVPSTEPVDVPPTPNARVTATPPSPPPAASANPAPRRAAASASAGSALPAKSTPWPLAGGKDPEPFQNALSYAAQPTPMDTRALQAGPGKPYPSARGDTTVVAKRSDERAPAAAAPRSEGAVAVAPPANVAKKPSSNSVVRVGDHFNDPWMRAVIVTPSAQDYMETTLFGVPDFHNLGAYLEKPTSAVAATFAEEPHPGMMTDRFAGNPITFVSTVSFGTSRAASR